METKVCKKCGIEKPLDEFSKHKGCNSGIGICKECVKIESREKYKNIDLESKLKNAPDNKICKICGSNKLINMFSKSKTNSDGYLNICRECKKKQKREWVSKNRDYILKYNKEHYLENRDNNLLKMKEYRENNKEYFIKKRKEHYSNNRESELKRSTKYAKENWDKVYAVSRERIKNNIIKHRENKNKRSKYRYANDELFRLTITARNVINKALKTKGFTKHQHTIEILGCSFEELKIHLESKFESWMNWENYGNPKDGIIESNKTWDIDHIIPLSSATSEEEILKLNHYTNLQPLCSYVNRYIKKHNMGEG